VLDLFIPPGEVGMILWVKNRLAHVITRECGDRIPAGPEGEQGELHLSVTAIGAKEQRSLVAGGAQGLSDTSAPKVRLELLGPFFASPNSPTSCDHRSGVPSKNLRQEGSRSVVTWRAKQRFLGVLDSMIRPSSTKMTESAASRAKRIS
jgi:hypothetical protein